MKAVTVWLALSDTPQTLVACFCPHMFASFHTRRIGVMLQYARFGQTIPAESLAKFIPDAMAAPRGG